jgi:hypothetical protein
MMICNKSSDFLTAAEASLDEATTHLANALFSLEVSQREDYEDEDGGATALEAVAEMFEDISRIEYAISKLAGDLRYGTFDPLADPKQDA